MYRIVVGSVVLMALFLGLFAMTVEPEQQILEAQDLREPGLQDKLVVRKDHVGLAQSSYKQR